MSVHSPTGADFPCRPSEYRAMQLALDFFYVCPSRSDTKIHCYEDCQSLQRCDFPDEKVLTKPTSVYPHGHRPVCDYCLERWRNDG